MTTLRIKNTTSLSDLEVISHVSTVINMGKISKTRGIPHYCFHSLFEKCRVTSGLTDHGVFWFVVSDVEDHSNAQSQES